MSSSKFKDISLILSPILFLFILRTLIFGETFTDWDGITIFDPMLIFHSGVLQGKNSLAFADQWFSGAPYLADYQFPFFSIYNLIGLLVSKIFNHSIGISFVRILAWCLLTVGQFFFLSLFTKKRYLQIYGSIAFSFVGKLYFELQHIPSIEGMSVLPWALYCIIKFNETKKNSYLYFIPLIFFQSAVSGSPYMFFCVTFCGFVTTLFARSWNKFFLINSLMALGIGLAAVHLIPFIEYIPETSRNIAEVASRWVGSFHPAMLTRLFVPSFFGSVITNLYGEHYFGPSDEGLYECYLGFLPLVCIFFLILNFKKVFKNFNRYQKIFVFFGLFFFLHALGRFTPAHYIYEFIPGLNMMINSARSIDMISFFIWPIVVFILDKFEGIKKFRKYYVFIIFVIISLALLANTEIYRNLYPPFTKTPNLRVFLIPFLISISSFLLLRTKVNEKLLLFLLMALDTFAFIGFEYRGLTNASIDVDMFRNANITNNRVVYSANIMKSFSLGYSSPSVIGYTSLIPRSYLDFLNTTPDEITILNDDFCAKLPTERLSQLAIKYLYISTPEYCSDFTEKKDITPSDAPLRIHTYEFTNIYTNIFETGADLKVEDDHQFFTFRKTIKSQTPSSELLARYNYFRGMKAFAKVNDQWVQMDLISSEPFQLHFKIPKNNASDNFLFIYEIPHLKTAILISLVSLFLYFLVLLTLSRIPSSPKE